MIAGPRTVSQLLVQSARVSDSGSYTCQPTYPANRHRGSMEQLKAYITIHILEGKAIMLYQTFHQQLFRGISCCNPVSANIFLSILLGTLALNSTYLGTREYGLGRYGVMKSNTSLKDKMLRSETK